MKYKQVEKDNLIEWRLRYTHERLSTISDIEVCATLVGGYGCRGEFEGERSRLIAETERLLDDVSGTPLPPAG